MNPNESWLDKVPDKYADMLNNNEITYDEFIFMTRKYRAKKTTKGLDLIG